MFLLTVKDQKEDGAYAVHDRKGNKVLFLLRKKMTQNAMLCNSNDQEDAEMEVIEVDGALAIRTCKLYNYRYTVVTSDIVIPPD